MLQILEEESPTLEQPFLLFKMKLISYTYTDKIYIAYMKKLAIEQDFNHDTNMSQELTPENAGFISFPIL